MQSKIFWSLKIKYIIYFLLLFSIPVWAAKTSGRIIIGGAASTERFNTSTFGSDKNDTFFSSQRLYYKVSEWGEDKWDWISDFRNKYDSFDKLNKELYQLDAKDEFQVRQFSLTMQNPKGFFFPSLGRIQIPEAGSVFVDGLNLQFRMSSNWYSGYFAGLNPKQVDKSYLISDSKASQYGAFFTYQNKSETWDKNKYLTHGIVEQVYNKKPERQFLFQNGIYQWQEDSRIMSLLYLDFVPRTYIQTANLIYQQNFSKFINSEISYLAIDVLEYQRRQNVLEKINPSPYKEGHLGIDFKFSEDFKWSIFGSQGERSDDQLKRIEYGTLFRLQNFISKNWDTQIKIINRKNFTSDDSLIAWNLGYFSNKFEIVTDIDYAIQKNNDGTITHPQNSELSLTGFFSKEFFATLSAQRAADENVTILGSFFKLGYRFGNQELPPIRDGAAPRGSL